MKTNKIYTIHWKYNVFPLYKPYLLIITWINALFYYRSICQADGYTAVIEANLGDTVREIFFEEHFSCRVTLSPSPEGGSSAESTGGLQIKLVQVGYGVSSWPL